MMIKANTRALALASIAVVTVAACSNGEENGDTDNLVIMTDADGNVVDEGSEVDDSAVANDDTDTSSEEEDSPATESEPGYASVVIGDEIYEAQGMRCQFDDGIFTYNSRDREGTGEIFINGSAEATEDGVRIDVYYEGDFGGEGWTTEQWVVTRGVLYDDPSFSIDLEAGTMTGIADFVPLNRDGGLDRDLITEGTFDISCA